MFHDTLFVKQDNNSADRKNRKKKGRKQKKLDREMQRRGQDDDEDERDWVNSDIEDSPEAQECVHKLEEFIQELRGHRKIETTRNLGQLQQLLVTQERLSPELACFSFAKHIETYPRECSR